MRIVFPGELPDGKGLAALTAAFDDEGFVPFRILPVFQDTLNFTFQHSQPSLVTIIVYAKSKYFSRDILSCVKYFLMEFYEHREVFSSEFSE
jgi:hypothetical protein